MALVTSLEETKTKSIKISERIKESSKLSTALESQRNVYRDLASKGTDLYLLIKDLSRVNNMYRFSLQEYLKVFKGNLDNPSGIDGDNKEKIKSMTSS